MKRYIILITMLLALKNIQAQTKMIIRDIDGNTFTYSLNEVGIVEFDEGGLEAVSLGLPSGTQWGSCNVGGLHPEDAGNFFAWGELTDKSIYNLVQYKLYDTIHGTYPYEDILEDISASKYDGATSNLGKPWKIPTKIQMEELIKECAWTWTITNGIEGYTVTGPNGKSIFLPAAGKRINLEHEDKGISGYYWASSLADRSDQESFTLEIRNGKKTIDYEYRYMGLPIRPVQ